ncbi:MAG: hypothetical protein CMD53_04880 [Gammaproteobacteria bacterium]|nr:hypothetical protein [Gammaproteobacteria bacterium]
MNLAKVSTIISFFVIAYTSSLVLILQIFDYRQAFSSLDKLKLEIEELAFQSNILIEEVQYYKSHISLRDTALNGLGMRIPTGKDKRVIYQGEEL